MNFALEPGDVERFRGIVGRTLGLHFEEARIAGLAEVLRRRVEASGQNCQHYLSRLEAELPRPELGALAQELTVPETYFFRNASQFHAFTEVVLPERMRARASSQQLRILSAGCASGEEAYSLAILVREAVLNPSWEVSVLGVDVNPAMLQKALRARYSTWALRETPPESRRDWFRPEGRDVVLSEDACHAVRFEERNLAEDDPGLWRSETYDVIFCRNVIMYFTRDSAQALVARITRALAPGGYLFLGHAETLRGLSVDFHLRHTHETFYYQRRERLGPPSNRPPLQATPPASRAVDPIVAVVDSSDTWVETIRRASARIQTLTDSSRQRVAARVVPIAPVPRSDLGVVLDLLQKERFSDALDLVQAPPFDVAQDPDVLLLRAVLLTHGGRLGEAEGFCGKVLEIDELNAGAHYVLALCREGTGDRKGAADHGRMAVYLDRTFAMPRLHLGLLARKVGDFDTARRELVQALDVLEREDPARLLLFGGGFGRETLISLCRAELSNCGGPA